LPTVGKPNSVGEKHDVNGQLQQQREYGSDGRAKKDTDYDHPQHHPNLDNPHYHDWTWNGNQPSRGDAYDNKSIKPTPPLWERDPLKLPNILEIPEIPGLDRKTPYFGIPDPGVAVIWDSSVLAWQ
jgi:hypothetical protein